MTPEQEAAFAAALRDRPGQWAVFRESAYLLEATRINKGINPQFEPGQYEATCRRISGERYLYKIWVRWVGPNYQYAT